MENKVRNSVVYWRFKNSGNLQDGQRPAYVVKETEHHMLLSPITSKQKKTRQPTHVVINDIDDRSSMILTEQLFWVKKKPGKLKSIPISTWSRKRIESTLKVSLGITRPPESSASHGKAENWNPQFYRGQIYRKDDKDIVIVQNNVGNNFSPTTIVGGLTNGHIDSLFTVNAQDLEGFERVGRKRRLTEEVQEFIN